MWPSRTRIRSTDEPAARWSSSLPLERPAKLVGERAEAFRRSGIGALGVFAHFVGFLRVADRPGAQTDAAAGGLDFEDDHFDIAADRERAGDVTLSRHAGLGHGNKAGASRRNEHEDAELLVTLDFPRETNARSDLHGRRASGSRRSPREHRNAGSLLLGIDAQDLERTSRPRRDLAGPAARMSGRRERRHVREPLDSRLELDE